MAVGLHDPLAGYHLLDVAVDQSDVLLSFHEIAPGNSPEFCRDLHRKIGHQDRNQGERQGQHDHGDEGGYQGDEGLEQIGDSVPNHLPQRVHVIRVDRHDVSVGMGVEVTQRKVLHVGEKALPEFQHCPLPHKDHYKVVGI